MEQFIISVDVNSEAADVQLLRNSESASGYLFTTDTLLLKLLKNRTCSRRNREV